MASSSAWWKGMRAADIGREVYAAARAMFPAPEWYTAEEIAVPGSNGSRRADLVALSIWGPTRVVVCEVKVTRADFMNEIRDPSKRAAGLRFGTEFAFIVPYGLVQADEIPDGCGLYEVQKNRRIRRTKIGKQKTQAEWTPAMFHSFIKAIVYRADATYGAFKNAGREGSKVYRELFRAMGHEWTLDELIELTNTLHIGLRMRKADVEASRLDYFDRVRADPEIQRLRGLESAVARLCGYGTNTGEAFTEWHARNTASDGIGAKHDLNDLRWAHKTLSRILDRHDKHEEQKRAVLAQEGTNK